MKNTHDVGMRLDKFTSQPGLMLCSSKRFRQAVQRVFKLPKPVLVAKGAK